eukprot:4936065-Amphidinium_carterae.1
MQSRPKNTLVSAAACQICLASTGHRFSALIVAVHWSKWPSVVVAHWSGTSWVLALADHHERNPRAMSSRRDSYNVVFHCFLLSGKGKPWSLRLVVKMLCNADEHVRAHPAATEAQTTVNGSIN